MNTINFLREYQGVEFEVIDNWNAHKWSCTLEYNGNTHTLNYFMGMGLTEAPKLDQVLESLFDDLNLYEEIEDALDLVENYGFTPKDARKVYPQLEENAEGIKKLFGNELEAIRDYCMEAV